MARGTLLAAILACATSGAQAQHKLFATDVLDHGQTETEFAIASQRTTAKIDSPLAPIAQTDRATWLSVVAGQGLGSGWQLDAGIRYYTKNESVLRFETPGGPQLTTDRNGWGDLQLGAKYLLYGDRDTPFTIATRADLALDTAGAAQAGAQSNALRLALFASARVGDAWRPYSSISVTGRDRERSDFANGELGVYYAPSNGWYLQARVSAQRESAERGSEPINSYGAGLSAAVSIARGWYVTSAIDSSRARDFNAGPSRFHSVQGQQLSVSLYGLF